MSGFRKLLGDKRGVGAIEYALVASLISVAAITGYANLGSKVNSHFEGVNQNLSGHM